MSPTVIVVAADRFAATAGSRIADLIRSAIETRGACSLALCGGHTPVPVLEDLVGRSIRWAQVTVYFGDERAVAPDQADSNFAMARLALLNHVPIPAGQVHRMEADRADRAAAALAYDRLLPDRLDVLLLGVGADGHTASLFPGSDALTELTRRVVAVPAPPPPVAPPVDRMTITPPVIDAARNIVVMVRGSDKAEVLARILEGPHDPIALPAQLARQGTWILDRAAAARLHGRGC